MCKRESLLRESDVDSHEFILPFIPHVLSTCYWLDTLVGAGNTTVRRKGHGPRSHGGVVCGECMTLSFSVKDTVILKA